jgi:hypothetical protein
MLYSANITGTVRWGVNFISGRSQAFLGIPLLQCEFQERGNYRCLVKEIVQRNSSGSKVILIDRHCFTVWLLGILLKISRALIVYITNTVSTLNPKYVAYPSQ